jgi:hypothetical protein
MNYEPSINVLTTERSYDPVDRNESDGGELCMNSCGPTKFPAGAVYTTTPSLSNFIFNMAKRDRRWFAHGENDLLRLF